MPREWRLLWVTDGCSIQPLPIDPQAACQEPEAQVAEVEFATTLADSAAHLITARFCSAGSGAAESARYLLDLPAGSRGKLKIVALDPADPDSHAVVESNAVTFNGGVDAPYSPVIFRAIRSHPGIQLSVTAVGTGLAATRSATVETPGSWSVPLTIVERSDSTLTAVADVPAPLPASVLQLSTSGSGTATTAMPADVILEPEFVTDDSTYYKDPNPQVYPKDFAFIYNTVPDPWRGMFHLIYTRHHKNLPYPQDTRVFGHAWSSDLKNWGLDTTRFMVRAGWDGAHIWAPTVLQVGTTSFVFYTGVDAADNQRIGYATTTLIDTTNTSWHREDTWVFSADSTNWAHKETPQQFRDPFVMAEPDSAGRFLMFYAALNDSNLPYYAVGVARNMAGTMDRWTDLGYYRSTDFAHSGGVVRAESPHVFPDPDYPRYKTASQATWRLMLTDGPADPDRSILFENKTVGEALSDTTLDNWTRPATRLLSYLDGNPTSPEWGWEATEYLRAGAVDFLAAYDGAGIRIRRMYWSGTEFILGTWKLVAVEDPGRTRSGDVRLAVTELVPGTRRVGFRIELPAPTRARLAIYDVMGRRVRNLLDRDLPAGRTPVVWDGHDASGSPAPTGMYFARLSWGGGERVIRVPLVR
ncbi:MAG: hypothetical protein HZC42_12620 [Candidatus Eisenbacteria bacterium]|nr:hypothetical protein [Candidatus Eisenbacteria bacterium]